MVTEWEYDVLWEYSVRNTRNKNWQDGFPSMVGFKHFIYYVQYMKEKDDQSSGYVYILIPVYGAYTP